MIKTGKVRSNLMINVRPTNAKLRLRCIGIVCELCGCDEKIAAELIDQYEDISIAIEEFEKANR